jgi:serpin B
LVVVKPKIFHADHPFLYLIRDRKTGAVLFLGQVVNLGG